MIRTALKRGIKKVLGMEERVSPAPPPPAWKAETAASTSQPAPAAPVEAPAVKTPEAAPVREEGVASAAEVSTVKAESAEKPAQLQWTPDERERPGTPLIAEHAQVPVAPPKKELPPSPSVQPVGADDVVGKALSMEAVQEIMDEMVRPALQGDGGDITLIKVENNDIFVKLVGACSTCPSSIMTMKMGVEALLKEEFPEMGSLIQVDS